MQVSYYSDNYILILVSLTNKICSQNLIEQDFVPRNAKVIATDI